MSQPQKILLKETCLARSCRLPLMYVNCVHHLWSNATTGNLVEMQHPWRSFTTQASCIKIPKVDCRKTIENVYIRSNKNVQINFNSLKHSLFFLSSIYSDPSIHKKMCVLNLFHISTWYGAYANCLKRRSLFKITNKQKLPQTSINTSKENTWQGHFPTIIDWRHFNKRRSKGACCTLKMG